MFNYIFSIFCLYIKFSFNPNFNKLLNPTLIKISNILHILHEYLHIFDYIFF